jgi:hypothetical protein
MARKFVPLIVGAAVLAAVGAGGWVWWQGKQAYETTDNAYVQADTVTVSPQVEGYVAEVLVADNQRVQAARCWCGSTQPSWKRGSPSGRPGSPRCAPPPATSTTGARWSRP